MSKVSARAIAKRTLSVFVASAMVIAVSAMAQEVKEPYQDFEGGPLLLGPDDGLGGLGITAGGTLKAGPLGASSVGLSFKGVSQYDLRATNLGPGIPLGSSFIPPDTMGAIGASQFMETSNGVYAIYDKSTGALQSKLSATAFWGAAGATGGANGDARVLFDKTSQKWIAIQFGASVSDIQIAVSTTSNALGPWQSTKFTGFAGGALGGVADYPTLAIDAKGVYIGTNNFTCTNASCSTASFSGTTLNVIARDDLLGAGPPTTASLKQFVTATPTDRGFAIQGVNGGNGSNSGLIVAASLVANDSIRYNVINPGTAGATRTAVTYLGLTDYELNNGGGRQPDGTRNIDPLDQRIGANAWEMNGKIYAVYTATPLGGDHTEVRWFITDEVTNAIIQQGTISDPNYDFYEGSLAVNEYGQVVIGYNRSGFQTTDLNGDGLADGNVSFFARTYNSYSDGELYQTDELLLHVSPVSNYHNGSVEGAAAVGRQRWGDYSAVTLDPNDPLSFWAIGQYAELWNNAAGCGSAIPAIPGCTLSGGSTWGTWISDVRVALVPEPQTYALLIAGLLGVGATMRRKTVRKG